MAVANGWLQRAHSLLADLDRATEYGWLSCARPRTPSCGTKDPVTARSWRLAAREIGRALGEIPRNVPAWPSRAVGLVSEAM